jgi:hypothetical protein
VSSQFAYIEVFHTVVVLAWSEYKAGHITGPTEYSQVHLGCCALFHVASHFDSKWVRADGHQDRDEPGAWK